MGNKNKLENINVYLSNVVSNRLACTICYSEISFDKDMKKKITLKSEKIEYEIRKHRRAKRLKMTIYCGGTFVVTVPWRMNLANVERFIKENSQWVLEKLKTMKKMRENSIFVKNNPEEYLELKEAARKFVLERLGKLNKYYNFKYKKIAIRNQKTRWGSCSSQGNLNFNYKILLLPQTHADYILVHELCHLKEFNHSRRFWNLVAQTIPNYQKIIEDLRII